MRSLSRAIAFAVLTVPRGDLPMVHTAQRGAPEVLQDWSSAAGDAGAVQQLTSLSARLTITRLNTTNSGGPLGWHGQLWLLPPSRYLKTESDDRENGIGPPRGHGVNGQEVVSVNGPDPKSLSASVTDGLYRADATRLRWMSILLLHAKPEALGATLTYLGTVEIDGRSAELLEMTAGPGPDGLGLAFDKETRRPIGVGPLSTDSQGKHTVALSVKLSEFKLSSKVLLPFMYQYFFKGTVAEEWSVDTYELNLRTPPPELK
jgi:hypothetical protein